MLSLIFHILLHRRHLRGLGAVTFIEQVLQGLDSDFPAPLEVFIDDLHVRALQSIGTCTVLAAEVGVPSTALSFLWTFHAPVKEMSLLLYTYTVLQISDIGTYRF